MGDQICKTCHFTRLRYSRRSVAQTSLDRSIDTADDTSRRKPSTGFLILLNALVFLALLLPGLNPIGWILAIPATIVFVAVSGVWQAIWVYLDRRFRFYNVLRCGGFVLPAMAHVVLPYLGVGPTRPINKQKPASSETGEYRAYVLAKSGGWTVEIQDQSGKTLHDEQTDFVPHLNVYWIWGPNDRFWIYNSDDGRVHCWYSKPDGAWQHVLWGYGHTQETDVDLGNPPKDLYPDYASRSKNATELSDERADWKWYEDERGRLPPVQLTNVFADAQWQDRTLRLLPSTSVLHEKLCSF